MRALSVVPLVLLALLSLACDREPERRPDETTTADGHGHAHDDDTDHARGSEVDDHEHAHDDDTDHAHGTEGDDHGHAHDDDTDHAHGTEGDDHGHAHDGGGGHDHGGGAEVLTRWGDATQLFVEFPPLVLGESSPFAAHLTRLSDHLAIDRGTVTVELSAGGNPPESFRVDRPEPAGIFRPVVRPQHAGKRRVTLRLDSPIATEVHEMGEYTVFPSPAEAHVAGGGTEATGEISFLLEQQWNIPFRVARAETRNLRPNLPAFARLTLPSDAEALVTAPRAGRIGTAGAGISVGGTVAAGAALFTLSAGTDGDTHPASIDLAVEQAEIRVEAARREVDRVAPLVEEGVVAQRRLDEARSDLSVAEAELRSARRRLASLGRSQAGPSQGDALPIPSPIAGAVAEIHVAPGVWVSEGQTLARVVRRGDLWLEVDVPEAYAGRLRDVSGAWFRLENYDGILEVPRSALLSVAAKVDPITRTLPVRFLVEDPPSDLFAGMTTQAHLITDAPRAAVAVNVDAVVEDGGLDVVYVQTGGESFVRRPVRLGIRDGEFVEALAGVTAGEWVVTRGAYAVKLASTSTEAIGHGHAH